MSDLKLDLLATLHRGSGQGCKVVEGTGELRHGLDQRGSLKGALSSFAPQASSVLNLTSVRVVPRQQLWLVIRNLIEVALYSFRDTSMQRPSWLAQQRAIGCVLHQSVLEKVSRMRRHPLAKNQASLN